MRNSGILLPALMACASWMGLAQSAIAQPYTFTATNIVVERVGGTADYGPGAGALSNAATAVFIDQFLPTTAAQTLPVNTAGMTLSIALPTTPGTLAVTESGTATSNGYMTRTADGLGLVVSGYNAALGTASVAGSAPGTINRSFGHVTASGINSTNGFSDGPTNNFRSAVSVDGSSFYASTAGNAGAAGILLKSATGTVTTTTPILIGNTRNLLISNNSMFASAQSATSIGVGVFLVGSAGTLPTSTVTSNLLPGTSTSGTGTPSPYGFFLLDNPLNANNWNATGLDTLYVADDRTAANGGGIQRWVFNGLAWALDATVNTGIGARGLTGSFDPLTNTTTLFFTTAPAGSNDLVTVSDVLTATSGVFSSFTTLATSPTNTVFRGVALAPVPEPVAVLSICAAAGSFGGIWYRRRNNRAESE